MKVLVTGGSGLVGNHLKDILTGAVYISSKDYNLTRIDEVRDKLPTAGAIFGPSHALLNLESSQSPVVASHVVIAILSHSYLKGGPKHQTCIECLIPLVIGLTLCQRNDGNTSMSPRDKSTDKTSILVVLLSPKT